MMLIPTINFYHRSQEQFAQVLSLQLIWRALEAGQQQLRRRLQHVFALSMAASVLLSSIAMVSIFFPDTFYRLFPFVTRPIEASYETSTLSGDWQDGTLYSTITLPAQDENLPEGNWLVIPKIGVRTKIQEQPEEKMEDALRSGVWRVPDFSDPMHTGGPMIVIAHRFGYLRWSNQFRRENSFFNLDKLEIGDTFEVIWDKRRFTYEIYAGEEGEEITDYSADIILYTCKFLHSPVRYFRYARRVEW